MFKKVYVLLLVLAINVQAQNPEEESVSTHSQPSQQVVDSSNEAVSADNSSDSYYKAKLKELENNEAAHQAKELRENIGLGLCAVNTALNVGNSIARLINHFNPSEAKKTENERAKKIRMELVAARLLSECMLKHLKDELDEKYKMPKACEKEIHALLNLMHKLS